MGLFDSPAGGGGPEWTSQMRQMMEKVMPRDVPALIKSLVPMLGGQVLVYLGKAPNPLFGSFTRDLEQAHLALECASALLDRIDSRLTDLERTGLRAMLSDLQVQYVKERDAG